MIIIPSLMACPSFELRDYVMKALQLGVKTFHIDVMDGVFVENFAMPPSIIKEILRLDKSFRLQVHLMIKNPSLVIAEHMGLEDRIDFFIHPEQNLSDKLLVNHSNVNLAFNLWEQHEHLRLNTSQALAMAVPIGRCGQKVHFDVEQCLSDLSSLYDLTGVTVDGGVSLESLNKLSEFHLKGAVMGSGIFNQSCSPLEATALAIKAVSVS